MTAILWRKGHRPEAKRRKGESGGTGVTVTTKKGDPTGGCCKKLTRLQSAPQKKRQAGGVPGEEATGTVSKGGPCWHGKSIHPEEKTLMSQEEPIVREWGEGKNPPARTKIRETVGAGKGPSTTKKRGKVRQPGRSRKET